MRLKGSREARRGEDLADRRRPGPVTRKLLDRDFDVFGDPRYERLAGTSNGHLCNLRQALQVRPATRGSPSAIRVYSNPEMRLRRLGLGSGISILATGQTECRRL